MLPIKDDIRVRCIATGTQVLLGESKVIDGEQYFSVVYSDHSSEILSAATLMKEFEVVAKEEIEEWK